MTNNISEILKLSLSERILMVEAIWDSIANESAQFPITEKQKNILEERLVTYNKNPQSGKPWEQIRNELLKKYGL
jgi:putative addiction module component (TIGR02574 family)